MKIATRELPKIVELLFVGKQPHFVVLIYEQYARLAVAGSAAGAPDTVAVLDFAGEHLFVVVGFDEYRAFLGKFVVEGRIDEDRYLTKYDDIRLAVAAGLLKNGTEHYIRQGYFERREVRLPPKDT